MPQDLHGHPRVDVERRQRRPARLPCAVHGDPGNSRTRDAAVEAAAEVARLDRRAAAGGERQAGVNPGACGADSVGVLLLPAELERGDAQLGKGEGGIGRLGLGLPAQQLAADALKLLADVKLTTVEVDQLPAEPEEFPLRSPRTRTRM
jgi:hypothetical protein